MQVNALHLIKLRQSLTAHLIRKFFSIRKIYRDCGDYYSPAKITKVLQEIDKLVAVNNLQFIEHDVVETIMENEVNLKFNIREGEKILVERINIKGNNVTNESVIELNYY